MLGVNQVIMQCLAMVVIASFIGQPGLGHDLLARLQNLRLGQAFEIGVAVVLIAVTLDRFSQALVEKEPERIKDGPLWVRHPYLCAMALIIAGSMVLASLTEAAVQLPKDYTVSISGYLDAMIKFITTSLFTPLGILRDFLLVYVFMPTKATFQSMPWVAVMALIGCVGWKLGRWKLALTVMGFVFFIAASGYWARRDYALYGLCGAVHLCRYWHSAWYLGGEKGPADEICSWVVRYLPDLPVFHLSAASGDAVPDQRCLGDFCHCRLCHHSDHPLYHFRSAQHSEPDC